MWPYLLRIVFGKNSFTMKLIQHILQLLWRVWIRKREAEPFCHCEATSIWDALTAFVSLVEVQTQCVIICLSQWRETLVVFSHPMRKNHTVPHIILFDHVCSGPAGQGWIPQPIGSWPCSFSDWGPGEGLSDRCQGKDRGSTGAFMGPWNLAPRFPPDCSLFTRETSRGALWCQPFRSLTAGGIRSSRSSCRPWSPSDGLSWEWWRRDLPKPTSVQRCQWTGS